MGMQEVVNGFFVILSSFYCDFVLTLLCLYCGFVLALLRSYVVFNTTKHNIDNHIVISWIKHIIRKRE